MAKRTNKRKQARWDEKRQKGVILTFNSVTGELLAARVPRDQEQFKEQELPTLEEFFNKGLDST